MAVQVVTDRGGATGVRYVRGGCEHPQRARPLSDFLTAAAARELVTVDRYAHPVGGCRMPEHGVVGADLRTFPVPDLLVTDGRVLPTQEAANPALTILALADRAASLLVAGERAGPPLRPERTMNTADRAPPGSPPTSRSPASTPPSARCPPTGPRPGPEAGRRQEPEGARPIPTA
ncbi:GMC oxidoreductase [Streptomyces sp. NPDC015661]|uniref:GMC oxidoreductase n=1 Tax=Streptomyces sp. NPDC015661 TaxID=3364961 RepID=UPI0036F5C329